MFLLDFPKNMQSLKNIPPPRIFLLTPLYILELTSANTTYCEKGAEGAHCAPEFMMPLLAVLPFALEEAHICPPGSSLVLLLFTPKQRLHSFLPYFSLACISESNFDFSSAHCVGPFLLG